MSLLYFAGKRPPQSIPVLFAITVIAFAIIHLVPGDPTTLLLGIRATDEAQAALRAKFALDLPLTDQFLAIPAGRDRPRLRGLDRPSRAGQPILGTRIAVTAGPPARGHHRAAHRGAARAPLRGAAQSAAGPPHPAGLDVTFAMPAFWMALVLVMVFSI